MEEIASAPVILSIAGVLGLTFLVFVFGFRAPVPPPTFEAFDTPREKERKKKPKKKAEKKPGKNVAAPKEVVEEVVEKVVAAKAPTKAAPVKAAPQPKKQKAAPEPKKQEKPAQKAKKTKKDAKPVVKEVAEDEAGDWTVAAPKKKQKPVVSSPKRVAKDKAPAPAPVAVDTALDLAAVPVPQPPAPAPAPAPAPVKEEKQAKKKTQDVLLDISSPEALEAAVAQLKASSGSEGSPAHSSASHTGSSLSDSWVSPDEVRQVLKDFDKVAAAAPSPTAAKKKKKKSGKAGAKESEPSIPVEEVMMKMTQGGKLGDRGNPYAGDAASELAAVAQALGSGGAAKPSAREAIEEVIMPGRSSVYGDRGNPYASGGKAGKGASSSAEKPAPAQSGSTEAKPPVSFDELGEEWVEAKPQKKKKQRVRRDN